MGRDVCFGAKDKKYREQKVCTINTDFQLLENKYDINLYSNSVDVL